MHFILIGKDGAKFYLLPNTSYTVGRKDCDLLIVRDESISRRHAELVNDKVSIMDVGSRYGTFINNTKLTMNASSVLQDGATVKFGMLQSIYKFQAVSIVNTTSGIKSEHKTQLKDNMVTLGGLLVQNWKKDCNYVTVEEMMLTVKVLSAVIAGVPIVNVSYWDDYVKCVKAHEPLPDVKNYVPKCSEVIINDNISFEYKEERRELFKNKLFVFPKKSDNEKMVGLINLAGGDSVSWDTHPVSVDEIVNGKSKEYIVMQMSNIHDSIQLSQLLTDFVHNYTKLGYRTIPLAEIALAIIKCSCIKHCNPKFKRKTCVFKTCTGQVICSDVGMNMTEASMEVNSLPNKENDLEYNEKESKRIKVDNWSSEESKGNIQKPVAKKSLFTFTHSNILTANLNSFSSFFVQHVSLSCAILLTSFQFMPPPFNCLSYLFFPSYLLCLLISFVCLVLNVLVCYRIII